MLRCVQMRLGCAAMGSEMRILLGAITALAVTFTANAERASVYVPSPRQSFNFDSGWKFHVGDVPAAAETGFAGEKNASWRSVTLPYAFNEGESFARDIHDLSTGIVWYRKHFRLPATFRPGDKTGHAFLEFQGVRQAADVWINGVKVGYSENGIMAFGFDITKALRPGDNIVSVRVDNDWKYKERTTGSAYQWSDKNFYANYGGINKPVRLHLTGATYQTLPLYSNLGTTGAYVWAGDFDVKNGSATIHAETELRSDSARTVSYSAVVRDADGKVVATIDSGKTALKAGETITLKAEKRLSGLHFWSWGYGYLYTVTTVVRDDSGKIIDAVDTRTGFRKTGFDHGVFTLNDRVLMLKGYAQRTTDEWPAVAMSVPPWVSDFTGKLITGSNGNLVRWMHVTPSKQQLESSDRIGLISNLPAGDSENDVTGPRWNQRVAVMRDAIIYNRNNPSVIFIESGNKGISEDHMGEMKALRDQYDPHGGRAIGSREMLDSKIAEYGGEMLYINKSAGKPVWAHEYSRDEAPRTYQDEYTPPFAKDRPLYNRTSESMAVEDVVRWNDYYEQRPGIGDRVSAGGVKIGFTDSNSHFRGDNNYRRSGVVDAVRIPKDAWYVHQVMWGGWVNSNEPRTHIIGHWNYAPGTVKTIYVVSNGDAVELFRNGQSLGKGLRSNSFLFTFKDVVFEPGNLKAVASYADGRHSQIELKTTGAPASLRLTAHTAPRGLAADGADLMLVDVEVVDKDGNRVPTAFNSVKFNLSGPAVWKGGIAQIEGWNDPAKKASANGIGATTLPVELGINRVLIRAGDKAGTVRLTASAEGLKPATLSVQQKPVAAPRGGLSTVFAEDALSSDLSRGASPATETFKPTLRTIPVATITAGSNETDVAKSHNDNDNDAWKSNGKHGEAWIEYHFATPETVSMLSLKMTGWRIRSYPVRITLDGKTLFEGATPKTLGYINLPVAPTTGKTLRIEQTGPSTEGDGFGSVVEVKDKRIAASVGAENLAVGWTLSITEADILGPAQ